MNQSSLVVQNNVFNESLNLTGMVAYLVTTLDQYIKD